MILIIGLGNPDKEYEKTYHNMGFLTVEHVAKKLTKKSWRAECNALTINISVKGEKIVIAKPQTYMNLSGDAVKKLARKYDALPSEIIVIYDDIDLERFAVRCRESGSAGTHNGMKNIVSSLETDSFKRIRIGIGRGEGRLKDFVLSEVTQDEMEKFDIVMESIAEGIARYIHDKDFQKLMRNINTKTLPTNSET